jgi:hypothetical protein
MTWVLAGLGLIWYGGFMLLLAACLGTNTNREEEDAEWVRQCEAMRKLKLTLQFQ